MGGSDSPSIYRRGEGGDENLTSLLATKTHEPMGNERGRAARRHPLASILLARYRAVSAARVFLDAVKPRIGSKGRARLMGAWGEGRDLRKGGKVSWIDRTFHGSMFNRLC